MIKYLLLLVLFISCGSESTQQITDGVSDGEHRIFITSTSYNGSLGGLSGADSKCNQVSSSAGLVRSYKAILSDGSSNAVSRVSLIGPVFTFDNSGTKVLVTSDPLDLWNGSNLNSNIQFNESGQTVSGSIWTGSSDSGTSKIHCSSWSGTSGSGRVGTISGALGAWLDDADMSCSSSFPIYCISL